MILGALLICGCATKPSSVTTAETAKESISAMVKALPTECRTDLVKDLAKSAQAQVDSVVITCQTEKRELSQTIRLYQVVSALLVVVLLFVLKSKLA